MKEGYWIGENLLDQIKSKALPIVEALYLRYEQLFMFDSATSHAIYAKNTLQVAYMSKDPGVQQLFSRAGWYINTDRGIIT